MRTNATLSLDEAGRLVLPNTALRVLGMKPGDQVRADVSPNRIDICPEPPVMAKGVIENGVLVMARQGRMLSLVPKCRVEANPQTVAQLDAQIAATERQIDILVYDLYGLTDKEIGLVEGA